MYNIRVCIQYQYCMPYTIVVHVHVYIAATRVFGSHVRVLSIAAIVNSNIYCTTIKNRTYEYMLWSIQYCMTIE